MTQSCYDYMLADATYQKLNDKVSKSWEKHRELLSDRRTELRNIITLSHAIDLTRKQSWKFEETSTKLDKQLENLTGDCGECWFYTFDRAGDLIEQYQGQLAQKVNEITVNIEKNKLERDLLITKRNDLGEKLRKQFHKQEEATDAVAAAYTA